MDDLIYDKENEIAVFGFADDVMLNDLALSCYGWFRANPLVGACPIRSLGRADYASDYVGGIERALIGESVRITDLSLVQEEEGD